MDLDFPTLNRWTIVLIAAATLGTPTWAAGPTVDLHIPAGHAQQTLQQFYQQSRVRLLYLIDNVKGVQTQAVSGELVASDALAQMLKGTRLDYEFQDEYSAVITRRSVPEISDVIVEAQRLFWFAPEQQPAAVVGRKEIERLGVSSVGQIMQYLTQQPFSIFEGARTDGTQRVQLRGLGSDTTVVLVNGHRVRAAAALFDSNAFDINTIPLVAVDRVEVYLDSTPFSVGADAIGGVVNIVLKSNVRAPKVDLHYGTSDGGARERRVSLSMGRSRETFQATAILDYSERDELLGRERDRWRNQDYRRFGGMDWRSLDSNPGNVSSLTAANLPGLPSRFAAVPRDQSEPLTSSDFLSTAGERNLTSLYGGTSVLPDVDNVSMVMSADWKISAGARAFGELLYMQRNTAFHFSPVSLSNVVIPAGNSHNPFGVPVRANFAMPAIENEQTTTRDYAYGLLGVRGERDRLGWEIALLRTQDHSRWLSLGRLNMERVLTSLAESDPSRSLNVFDDGPGGSAALLDSLRAPVVPRYFDSAVDDLTAQVRTDLFSWAAGTSTASLGVQWTDFQLSVTGTLPETRSRTISSAFAQWTIPLLAGEASDPALAASVQGRLDRISDLDSVINSQLTLDWRSDTVSVRATYGTGYRAPTLFELYQPRGMGSAPLPDAKRGGAVSNVTILFGGNSELKMATATSWSVGLTLRPERARRFRFTGTFWQTSIADRISILDMGIVLSREELFQERLMRASPTPGDMALGRPGPIVSLDVTSAGEGTLDASGFDLQASMNVDTRYGRFSPELSATWMREFRVVEWPGLPALERVSLASSFGTIPRWHGVAGVAWTYSAFQISTKARFVSAYADLNPFERRKTGRDVSAQTLVDMQASLHLDQDVEHEAAWRGTTISAGVTNLFDREPPFAEAGGLIGFDFGQGDLRQRFAYLRLCKEF